MKWMTKNLALGVLLVAAWVVPSGVLSQVEAPATGFALSARLAQSSFQELVASAAGAPEFTVGYRGDRLSIGLGVGLSRLSLTDRDEFPSGDSESEVTATLFQVGPDVLFRVWESPNGRTLGNVSLGARVGRLSATEEDSASGSPTRESTAKGTLLGFRAGLGGDHFLDPNFAIGLEAGFQANLARGIEEEGSISSVSGGASGAYAALRLTVVMGSD